MKKSKIEDAGNGFCKIGTEDINLLQYKRIAPRQLSMLEIEDEGNIEGNINGIEVTPFTPSEQNAGDGTCFLTMYTKDEQPAFENDWKTIQRILKENDINLGGE